MREIKLTFEVMDEHGKFNPKAKRLVQKYLLNDEKAVRRIFGGLQRRDLSEARELEELHKALSEPRKEGKKSRSIPIEDVLRTLMLYTVKLDMQIHDSNIITMAMLEMTLLNHIKLRRSVNELALALIASDNVDKEKVTKMFDRIQAEDKAIKKAVNEAKKMRTMTRWWDRRFEDLKEGAFNERI